MTQSTIAPPSPPPGDRPARPRERVATDYAELSRLVQAAGLMERRYAYYWTRIVLLVAAFVAVWVAFGLIGDSWFQLLVAAALSLVVTQFGFLGHDGAHRQIFASCHWNEWTARVLSGVFAGLSYAWWSSKHNRHHNAPNQEGKDPDIRPGVLAFTEEAAQARTGWKRHWTKRQGWAFFPLLLLEGAHLHYAGLHDLITRRGAPRRWIEIGLISARLVVYVAAVLYVLPVGKAVAFIALQMGLFGLFLGGSFAPNHKGMPIVPRGMKVDFLRRQVLMSRNVTGGPVIDFAMGGLNYQIEHHLFPSMPRPNLRRAQPIVENFCAERGVTYTAMSIVGSYRVVIQYLNTVGLRARDPFTCPLVTQYRG